MPKFHKKRMGKKRLRGGNPLLLATAIPAVSHFLEKIIDWVRGKSRMKKKII